MNKKVIDKEMGNLAIKEIVNMEIDNNQISIFNIGKLLYEIEKEYPYSPVIQRLVDLTRIEIINLASKNHHRKHYFETLNIALLYLEWVSKDIRKNHYKNVKEYFNISEIYKDVNKKRIYRLL